MSESFGQLGWVLQLESGASQRHVTGFSKYDLSARQPHLRGYALLDAHVCAKLARLTRDGIRATNDDQIEQHPDNIHDHGSWLIGIPVEEANRGDEQGQEIHQDQSDVGACNARIEVALLNQSPFRRYVELAELGVHEGEQRGPQDVWRQNGFVYLVPE